MTLRIEAGKQAQPDGEKLLALAFGQPVVLAASLSIAATTAAEVSASR